MKRLLSIFLFLLYTLTAEGVKISRHFCCGSLAAISMNKVDEDECCGEKKCQGCYDDHVVIKLKADHLKSQQELSLSKSFAKPIQWLGFYTSETYTHFSSQKEEKTCTTSSFSSSSPPIYLFDCSWLI